MAVAVEDDDACCRDGRTLTKEAGSGGRTMTTTTALSTALATRKERLRNEEDDGEKNDDNEVNDGDNDVHYGLDDPFTCTTYDNKMIRIPCFRGGRGMRGTTSNDDNDDCKEDEIIVDVRCSPSAMTDFDLTGQILWLVSGGVLGVIF